MSEGEDTREKIWK